jgi:hypothetical protein
MSFTITHSEVADDLIELINSDFETALAIYQEYIARDEAIVTNFYDDVAHLMDEKFIVSTMEHHNYSIIFDEDRKQFSWVSDSPENESCEYDFDTDHEALIDFYEHHKELFEL